MLRWQPIASMVTTVPLSSSASSSFGMAVISLDLSSTLRCARTRLLALAQAETMCTRVFLPAWRVPHNALPSMATTSPAVSLGDRRNPGYKALFHLFWVQRREYPVEGIVRRDAAGQRQKRLQPLPLGLTILRYVVPTLGPAQYRGDGNQKNLFQ